jgi:hypothetical protein
VVAVGSDNLSASKTEDVKSFDSIAVSIPTYALFVFYLWKHEKKEANA